MSRRYLVRYDDWTLDTLVADLPVEGINPENLIEVGESFPYHLAEVCLNFQACDFGGRN